MKELLTAIVSGLVEKPEEVTVTVDEPNEEGVVYYHIHVAENGTRHRQAGQDC